MLRLPVTRILPYLLTALGVGSFIKKCELITFNFYFLFEIVSAKEIVSEILVSKSFNLFTIRQSLT